MISTRVLLPANPINKHRDLQPLFPLIPANVNPFIRRHGDCVSLGCGQTDRQRTVTRCYQRGTCKRDPAALRRSPLMAQGNGAFSLSNYTWVCAGANKRLCTGITVMSKALMRIPWTPNARLPEYFSRCQPFESRVSRVQMTMLSGFGRLHGQATRIPDCIFGPSTLRCSVSLLHYLSCSVNALTRSTDFPNIPEDLCSCPIWPKVMKSHKMLISPQSNKSNPVKRWEE